MTVPPDLPTWLRPLVDAAQSADASELSPVLPLTPTRSARPSAVLVLFGDADPTADPSGLGDVLLTERAHTMRRHAGQMAFPGGMIDDVDGDAAAAALREAQEETGLDPSGVVVLATLPALYLPQRPALGGPGFLVTPVLGWWRTPTSVSAADPAEVASVHRVPLRHLVDPANRMRVRHPSGYVGPAFRLEDLVIWGFTAGLLDRLICLAGWERPWGDLPTEELPATFVPFISS